MRTPWTLSTIEAAIFIGLVLILAGGGTWASTVGKPNIPTVVHPIPPP
jgi:hypothetical protein